jgi:thiol-disulfide isomerase/thioredoxin
LPLGTPAPTIRLSDLNGHTVEVGAQDRPTLVLFWNPGCNFCQQMLADLQEWETNAPPSAPDLVVISTGDLESNRAQALLAPVLLAPTEVMANYGANGTPMAVLIDSAGLVASPLAAGRGEVMSLFAGTPAPAVPPTAQD